MKLYFTYAAIQLKTQMEYKLPFFVALFSQFLVALSTVLTMSFILDRFGSIGSFTLEHSMLCCSVGTFGFALARCFFGGFDKFQGLVKNGGLDSLLIRPVNTVFLILASNIRFERLGSALSSLAVLCYAVTANGLWTDPVRLAVICFMVLGAAAFFSGIYLLYATLCFFTLEGLEFVNVLTHGLTDLGKYPMGVYGKAMLTFFTVVLPFACAQYYPLLFVIGRDVRAVTALAPAACFVFLIPCVALWYFGLSRYQSTGS